MNDLIRRALRFGLVFSFLALVFYGFNVLIINGIVQPPRDARFLTNFDSLDQTKTWNVFKTEHDRLDPDKEFQSPSQNDLLTILPSNKYEELIYPKRVVKFLLSISVKESQGFQSSTPIVFKHPSFLVLVLDQSDRIRGKTYVRYATEDYFLKAGTMEYAFWFIVPEDMRGSKYSIAVEVFGALTAIYDPRVYSYLPEPQIREEWDKIYGHIPWWRPRDPPDGPWFRFLAYRRTDNLTAPPISIIDPWSIAFQASSYVSASIGILIAFLNKIRSYHRNHPCLRTYESLLAFWIASFLIFVFVVAIPR